MIMRSAKVPEIAFVGVADDIFLLRRGVGDGAPFDAGGEACAAATAQARGDHLLDDRLWPDLERLLEPGIAFMSLIVAERPRIDDAAAIEGEPGLALEPGDVVDRTEAEPVLLAVEHAAVEQTIDVADMDRAIADTALGPLDLDQRLEPIKPSRSCAHDLDIELALFEGLAEGGRDFLGADAQRAGIAGDEDARAHACASFEQVIELRLVEHPEHVLVEHGSRRGVAEPEAIDRLERDAGVGRGAAHLDAEPLLGACGESIAAGRLTGFGAAELQHAPSRRLLAEVVIERDGAVDLGAGEVERLGDQRHGRLGNAAECLLQSVQDGEGGALHMRLLGDDFAGALDVPSFVSMHAQLPSSRLEDEKKPV